MKKIILMLTLLTTNSAITFGQEKTISQFEKPYIEVNGTAEKEVIPDEIYIGIVIKERFENKIKITVESQEEKIKSFLKVLNIDLINLSLSDADANYVKINWKNEDVISKKEYILKVENAQKVTEVFKELEKIEIKDAFISRVNHSKIEELRKGVRIDAIKAAKEKADYLLLAINEQTGKPLIVIESTNTLTSQDLGRTPMRYMANRVSTDSGYFSDDRESEIQFQKIKIHFTIYVKFEIK